MQSYLLLISVLSVSTTTKRRMVQWITYAVINARIRNVSGPVSITVLESAINVLKAYLYLILLRAIITLSVAITVSTIIRSTLRSSI